MPALKNFWLKAAWFRFKKAYFMNREQYNSPKASAGEYPLSQLYFYLTQGCNLACKHCYLAPKFDPNGDRYPVLPVKLFNVAIQEALPLGLTGVKLTGGEPLLHPDILIILDILHQEKINLVLETNGFLCTIEIAKAIARLNKPFVSVSLDGADARTHDKIRGITGAFQKATAAIRTLVENDIKPQVIMSIMAGNVEHIEPVIALAEELGAGSLKFNIIQPTGRGELIHTADSNLDIEKLISLGRKVETDLISKTKLKLYFDYPVAFRSLRHIASGDGCGVCGILSILGVLPTGEYALCGMGSHAKNLVFGRIGQDALAKVWLEHQVLNNLRDGVPQKLKGVCGHCLLKHLCLGSCIAQNYYKSRSLWAPFWFCEQASEAGLFPDSRLDFSLINS